MPKSSHLPLIYPPIRGFTLIELLIVITIIGILATFIVASFTSAQLKGRDAKRKSDLDALKKALEFAKSDSNLGQLYPDCTAAAPGCVITVPTDFTPSLSTTYIRTIPKDPKTNAGYTYVPQKADGSVNCDNTTFPCIKYALIGCLENGNDPGRDAVFNATCTTPASYTILNP